MQQQNKPTPHPLIKEYVDYLSKPGIPYVSSGPTMLFRLHREHGHDYINSLLDRYWNDLRAAKRRQANTQ